MDVPNITRYDTNPDVVECVIPVAYGHLVYYTDHEIIMDALLYRIRELESQVVDKSV